MGVRRSRCRQISSLLGPQPLHRHAQHFILDLDIKHSTDYIPLCRPKMKQALIALTGNGILCLCQIKNNCAVVEHYSISSTAKKIVHCANQSFGGHSQNVFIFQNFRL